MYYDVIDFDIEGNMLDIPYIKKFRSGKYKTKKEALSEYKELVEKNLRFYKNQIQLINTRLEWVNKELQKEE